MTEIKNVTFDQKLKAFEIASRIITTSGPGEDVSQEEFNQYMADYLSTLSGIACLVLRQVDLIQP